MDHVCSWHQAMLLRSSPCSCCWSRYCECEGGLLCVAGPVLLGVLHTLVPGEVGGLIHQLNQPPTPHPQPVAHLQLLAAPELCLKDPQLWGQGEGSCQETGKQQSLVFLWHVFHVEVWEHVLHLLPHAGQAGGEGGEEGGEDPGAAGGPPLPVTGGQQQEGQVHQGGAHHAVSPVRQHYLIVTD